MNRFIKLKGQSSPWGFPSTVGTVFGNGRFVILPEDLELPVDEEGRPDPFRKGWLLYFDIATNPSFVLLYEGKNLTHLFDEYELRGDELWLHFLDGTSLGTFVDPLREEPGQTYTPWWQPVLRHLAATVTP